MRPAADPNAPSRPLTAYHYFIQAVKQERARAATHAAAAAGGVPVVEGSILDETTQRWKAMSERERRPYAARAQKARADHAVRMFEYRQSEAYQARACTWGGKGTGTAADQVRVCEGFFAWAEVPAVCVRLLYAAAG